MLSLSIRPRIGKGWIEEEEQKKKEVNGDQKKQQQTTRMYENK